MNEHTTHQKLAIITGANKGIGRATTCWRRWRPGHLEPELWPPMRQREVLASLLVPTLTAFADGGEGASDHEES